MPTRPGRGGVWSLAPEPRPGRRVGTGVDTCASRPLASAAARWRLARSSQPPGAAPAASAGHVSTSPVSRASYAPTPTVPSPVLLLRLRPGLTLWHGTDCLTPSPPLLCFACAADPSLIHCSFSPPPVARLARKDFPHILADSPSYLLIFLAGSVVCVLMDMLQSFDGKASASACPRE